MSLCLSISEIAELTRTSRRANQCRFLRENGIRHYVDSHGRPVVLRAAVEGDPKSEQDRAAWKSNKAA